MDRRQFLTTMMGFAAGAVAGASGAATAATNGGGTTLTALANSCRGVKGMAVGAAMNVRGVHDPSALESAMGLVDGKKLDFFRCYDSKGPAASWSRIGQHQFVGKRPLWWSCKGDVRTWATGGYDANAIALAKSYDPSWPEIRWTIWHEVQPKLVAKQFTFAEFKAAWTHFYRTVKPHCPPNMKLGIIHGGFAWKPGRPETSVSGSYSASPAEWRALPTDFHGVDCYGGPTADDIIDMPRFQRFVHEMCADDPTRCHIAESGVRQSVLSSNDVAEWIRRNGDRLAAIDLGTWCYWNSTATKDPGPLDPAGMRAFGDVWRRWSVNR